MWTAEFSADGRRVVTASADNTAGIWRDDPFLWSREQQMEFLHQNARALTPEEQKHYLGED